MSEPKVGVGIIVFNKYNPDRVLLGRRKGSHGAGTWSFPGGRLEYFEELRDCAKRELYEETGIKAVIDKYPVAATNDFFRKEKRHYITLYLRAKHHSGEPEVKEPNKCECWEWFRWSNLPEPLFLPIENLLSQGYNPFE